MKKIVGLLAIIGAISLALLLLAGLVGLVSLLSRPGVPSSVLLEVNLETGVIEAPPEDPVGRLMTKDVTVLRDVVDALDRAARDDRVEGLVARIGAAPMGLAQIQEIRDAVKRFRDSGKFAIAWSETFGEAGPGGGAYYLASAFDEIWMLPAGDVGMTGLMYESPFIKGTLDKLHVTPRFDHRYEYKNAMNLFTEKSFTAAHREAMQRLADSQFEQIVRGVAEGRGKTTDEVSKLIARGPFIGGQAEEAGLVDGMAYRDEVYDKARQRAGEKAKLLFLKTYLDRAGRPHAKGTTVALINGMGAVTRGKSQYAALSGEGTMGADSVSAAFRAAMADKKVKAILFRVDSPGGSYVASDAIWRETVRAKEKGLPVIVSMGNVAGSGGYFVAMAAEKIVAQPATITGSIGVLGGKMITRELWKRLGVTFDDVSTADNAKMFSSHYDYSEYGWAKHEQWLDRVYEDFTAKVADGRGLPLERVLEIARGRIWTGEDAKNLGLVDEVGGYDVALGFVRQALELGEEDAIRLKPFPRQKELLESFFVQPTPNSEPRAALELGVRTLRSVQPFSRALRQVGLAPSAGVLSMPPMILTAAEPAR